VIVTILDEIVHRGQHSIAEPLLETCREIRPFDCLRSFGLWHNATDQAIPVA
jgi:hypothetical protein